ncbi:MAG TPA: glutamate cyclase domain-containing protein [Acetobacteraceae bacterium]|nr:glutamate cyclase domain-containing protein [Acetobacteraceae bacterium]
MPDHVGEAVDRLISMEIKNRGMPFGILQPLYEAARKAAGGRPLTILAAEGLHKNLRRGDTVLVLTGAGYGPTMPKGESDGPPGAAALARILYRGLGAVPVFVCEACHVDPIVAASEAGGLMVRPFVQARDRRLGAALAAAPADQSKVNDWVASLYAEMKPKAVVCTERLGPGADGVIHTATALPLQGPESQFDPCIDISGVVDRANAEGIFSVGIGDHGNELGFGTIYDAVVRTMPKGDRMATVTRTDIVVPAMMSNWGCYGIEACLAFLLKRPELMHSPALEERIVRACLDAGGLEAMFCTTDFSVDGLDGETSMACVQILGNIVRKNLEPPDLGLTH